MTRATWPEIWRERALLWPAFSAAIGVGYLPLFVLPWTLGALVAETGRSSSWAGWVATGEIAALALASLVLARRATKPGRRWLAGGGTLVAILANLAATWAAPDSALFVVARIMSGAGLGAAVAAGNAAAASAVNPTRAFATLWFLMALWQLVIFNLTPWLIGMAGLKAPYGLIAAAGIAFLPFVLRLPDPSVASAAPTAPKNHTLPRGLTWLIVIAFFCFWLRDALVYAMSERIAVAQGLTGQQLGNILGVASILGLLGPILAARLGGGAPSPGLLAAGLFAAAVISVLMAAGISAAVFGAATLLSPVTGLFGVSLLSGLAGYMDNTGRLAAIGAGAGFVSEALGPAAGGTLVEFCGPHALAAAVVTAGVLTIATAFGAAVGMARRA